ncbi:hypothetical protein [Agromyces marinus]|uniref:hypothetical protein n=1 Tax=Agromyces marinus TaxID=1389020 RepID=UPI001F376876|nr:hypothetical protein [Agromyces marinus]UIP58107.1 hypothetical protein DSM26151_09770 [Agromyces marinus]
MSLLNRSPDASAASPETTHEIHFRRPSRSARAAEDIRSAHGGRRLAVGIAMAACVLVLAHLAHAIGLIGVYPPGAGPAWAWIALAVVAAGTLVATRGLTRVADWTYALVLVALVVPVWLDLASTAGLLHLGVTPTAAPAAAVLLMPVVALRETRTPVAAAALVALAITVAALLQVRSAGSWTVVGLAVAASALVPVVLAAVAVRGFRRLVGRELDLTLVQSTVATPRSAVGMRASEELAELDFDAESLLDDVGSGRLAIPLPADAAAHAGELAARLRVRLIEGRTDTWLRHAVTESAYLSRRVTVDDDQGLAGLLAPEQREGLLLALWLIAGQRRRKATEPPLEVRVRCHDALPALSPGSGDGRARIADGDPGRAGDDAGSGDGVAIDLDVSGVSARRIDATAWDALDNVGVHEIVPSPEGFRIGLECRIDPTVRGQASPSAVNPRGA